MRLEGKSRAKQTNKQTKNNTQLTKKKKKPHQQKKKKKTLKTKNQKLTKKKKSPEIELQNLINKVETGKRCESGGICVPKTERIIP